MTINYICPETGDKMEVESIVKINQGWNLHSNRHGEVEGSMTASAYLNIEKCRSCEKSHQFLIGTESHNL